MTRNIRRSGGSRPGRAQTLRGHAEDYVSAELKVNVDAWSTNPSTN